MTEESGQSEHFFLVSDLAGFFCCAVRYTSYEPCMYVLPGLLTRLLDLLRKHEAETDQQQQTGSPDHRHPIIDGQISTDSGAHSEEKNHTKIVSHLLQLFFFMIPHKC